MGQHLSVMRVCTRTSSTTAPSLHSPSSPAPFRPPTTRPAFYDFRTMMMMVMMMMSSMSSSMHFMGRAFFWYFSASCSCSTPFFTCTTVCGEGGRGGGEQ